MQLNNRELEYERCEVTAMSVTKEIREEVTLFAVKTPRFEQREIFAKATSSKLASNPQESPRLQMK